jgi:DNA integrity scanning protein DisA with diadenylate cyclase activity
MSETMLSRASSQNMTELRMELPTDEVSVLDGFCSAWKRSRTDVVREMLADWSSKKLHEASVICRVAGVNPTSPERGRSEQGSL